MPCAHDAEPAPEQAYPAQAIPPSDPNSAPSRRADLTTYQDLPPPVPQPVRRLALPGSVLTSRSFPPMSRQHWGSPQDLGQNFLVDPSVIVQFVDLLAHTSGPLVELGPGDGALTLPLARTGRPLTAVELDPGRVNRLRRRVPTHVRVLHQDLLRYRHPTRPHVVYGNVPFHLTTALLRRLLDNGHWTRAVLLVQWEVARRRAGVGGASLLTASWWPWYEFTLHRRVPARAFRPVPSVDGGLLGVDRRPTPLVGDREGYQHFVRRVFTGRGRDLPRVLAGTGRLPRADLGRWLAAQRLPARALPKDLGPRQWAELWELAQRG
ncbi:23S ribosomal RNA methyltransferase Erm [Streptomyces sp. NPDC005438]|uniref:23S ribosomal RNA methyltransferase Erm n=1 Tax=Streptomyces sp. NPDC005438 TaxID=3156880 RepID=UPI0033BD5FCE